MKAQCPTNAKYLWLSFNTSWVLVFVKDTHVYTISKVIGINKEKEICLRDMECISCCRRERINMVVKCIVHMNITAELLAFLLLLNNFITISVTRSLKYNPFTIILYCRFFNQLHTYCPLTNQWSHVVSVTGAQGQVIPPGTAGHSAAVVRNTMLVIGGSHCHGHR